MSTITRSTATPRSLLRPSNARRETLAAIGFLTPNLLGFLLLTLGPTVFSFVMGFTDWSGLGAPKWLGFQNYRTLMSDDRFLISVRNTALYTIEFVPFALVASLFLAVIFQLKLPGTNFFRALCFVPIVTDMISVSFCWTLIYDFRFGILNYVLGFAKIPPQAWLGDVKWALFALVLMSVWRWMGYYAVILLAGLQGVPREMYEAAILDGAGRWKTLLTITLPLISPTIFFVFTTSIMSSFQVFEQMFVMTEGGPLNSTISIAMFLYSRGFQFLKMGYASAVAWVLFFIIFTITAINWFVRKKWVFEY